MASKALDALKKQLKQAQTTYSALTDEQMNEQAQNKYASIYDQNRTSAQQAHDTTALALQQQRDSLAVDYARQGEAAQKATRDTLSSADRYSLQRGMQRSSYNNATLANIGLQGNRTLDEIQRGLTTAQGDIDERTTMLSQQLAQQLAQYDTQQQSDIQAYIDQLRQQEYERTLAAKQYQDQLAIQIYQLEQAEKRGSGGGGSSRGYSSAAVASTPTSTTGSFSAALAAAATAAKAAVAKQQSNAQASAQKPKGTSIFYNTIDNKKVKAVAK